MLICSLLIYFTAPLFKERPAGAPTVESLLPGLTFIDSTWWSKITGHAIAPIEGAFWSLFVEVKFYFFAALVFYWSGRNILILFLIASFAAAIFFRTLPNYFNPFLLPYINSLIRDASFEYFGWFASGAAFYVFFRNGTFSWLALASAMALLSSLTSRGLHWQPFIAGSLISLSFALAVISPTAQYILRLRLFQFLGLVSYPLYLIHENILISLIIKGGRFMSPEQSLYIPVLSLALLSIAAYFITQYLEPRVKQIIVKSSNFIGRQRA
jgi:peptidoglycan/LPS O-acetylase OafA/YrhL